MLPPRSEVRRSRFWSECLPRPLMGFTQNHAILTSSWAGKMPPLLKNDSQSESLLPVRQGRGLASPAF